MEHHTHVREEKTIAAYVRKYSTPLSILAAGALIAMAISYGPRAPAGAQEGIDMAALQEAVLPRAGVALPITWGDLGMRLVETGTIDLEKLEALYKDRGGFPEEYRKMLEERVDGKIVITPANAGYLLNLLWAVGLANANPILEDPSEMMDPRYAGEGPLGSGFASTGGWTLAKGGAMEHYNHHQLINLTNEQQALVDRVSRNIYRPCCGNSAHFPDCNHGMAMLGLLELLAAEGASEEEMYRTALAANSYWFPETYITIAAYMQQKKGVEWEKVSPREALGAAFSGASGFQSISSQVTLPGRASGGGSCSA